ncbi:MAG: reverse transcriptase-like protein [Actinobacteria bacterium]|nr:reverse transcriptase-like protein [Actinomycetota bacterium]
MTDESTEDRTELKKGLYLLKIDGGKKASAAGDRALGAYGFVLSDPTGKGMPDGQQGKLLEQPVGDPHSAEYEGLLAGLEFARQRDIQYIAVFSDSRTLVNQVNLLWKSSNHLTEYCSRASDAFAGFKGWQVSWIPRKWNDQADGEVRRAFQDAAGPAEVEHAD